MGTKTNEIVKPCSFKKQNKNTRVDAKHNCTLTIL